MADTTSLAAARWDTYTKILDALDLDMEVISTKADALHQTAFEAKILLAIVERIEALEARVPAKKTAKK